MKIYVQQLEFFFFILFKSDNLLFLCKIIENVLLCIFYDKILYFIGFLAICLGIY